MKKFSSLKSLWLHLLIVSMLVACNKDELPKEEPFSFNGASVMAQVYKGNKYNSKISTVKFLSETITTRTAPAGEAIASVNWENGGFTLNLPATINESYLRLVDEIILKPYYRYGLTYIFNRPDGSDELPRGCRINAIAAYDAAGNYFDELVLFNPETDEVIGPEFLYVDRDLTIRDSDGPQVSFKKGWNLYSSGCDFEGLSFNISNEYKNLWWCLSRDVYSFSGSSWAEAK